jgi:hypothetical protein
VTARPRLAALAGAAPFLVLAVACATVATPGYDTWRDTVSRLASPGQPFALFTRLAFVGYGVAVLAGAQCVADARRSPALFAWLLRVYGIAAVVAGVAPKDMPGAPHTAASELHVVATVVGGSAIVGAMLLTAASADTSLRLRRLSIAAAAATVGAAITFRFTWGTDFYGGVERAVLLPPLAWLSATAWLFTSSGQDSTTTAPTRRSGPDGEASVAGERRQVVG